jgi:hypothetical protein
MNLELNSYGVCFDTAWAYIAIDWKLITIGALGYLAFKVYKRKKAN